MMRMMMMIRNSVSNKNVRKRMMNTISQDGYSEIIDFIDIFTMN